MELRDGRVPTRGQVSARRDEIAVAVFGTWMVIGLFLDGWAHQASKPETFFSPWHGVLYSGFAAAQIFYGVEIWRQRRTTRLSHQLSDRLMAVGFIVFVIGAMGDFVWHEIFGIEVDLETLLSPTHLSLMVGGLLMVTAPIRIAWRRFNETTPTLKAFLPTLVCITLAAAVASFFLMYVSAFNDPEVFGFGGSRSSNDQQVGGIATILITNTVLAGTLLLTVRRWRTPFGSFTLLFGVVATLSNGLSGFERPQLILAALIGGFAADVLLRRGASIRVLSIAVPIVLWSTWYAVYHAMSGLGWAVDLWMGTILLAALTGLGLSVLVFPPQFEVLDAE